MFNNQKKPFLIESIVLLSPMLLAVGIILFFILLFILNGYPSTSGIMVIFVWIFYVLIVLLLNILFFSVLKNKLNMEIETLLYGIAFLSNCIAFTIFPMESTTDVLSQLFYGLALASLFYTYAAILKSKENKSRQITFFLTAMTIVFFVALIIKDFEVIKQYFESLEPGFKIFQSIIIPPILLGLFAGYYAVYRNIRISLRNAAWASFLVIFIAIFGSLLLIIYAIIESSLSIHYSPLTVSEPTPNIYYALPGVYYFLFSFAISCLAGIICKRSKKKQSTMQTNE